MILNRKCINNISKKVLKPMFYLNRKLMDYLHTSGPCPLRSGNLYPCQWKKRLLSSFCMNIRIHIRHGIIKFVINDNILFSTEVKSTFCGLCIQFSFILIQHKLILLQKQFIELSKMYKFGNSIRTWELYLN